MPVVCNMGRMDKRRLVIAALALFTLSVPMLYKMAVSSYEPTAVVQYALSRDDTFNINRDLKDPKPLEVPTVIEKLNAYKYTSKSTTDNNTRLYIEDIFIGVKSTKQYHSSRLGVLLDTWIPQASGSVHLITDDDDEKYSKIFGADNFVNTGCGVSHGREHLACKFQRMYDVYMSKMERFKWFCSVDDDNYIIVPNLVKILEKYDTSKDWYIGKPSLSHQYSTTEHINQTTKNIKYWFATGGAGVCISRGLAVRMFPLCGERRFVQRATDILNPDDTTLGYVCNYLLGVNLTVISEFHSHIEPMWEIHPLQFHKQVTLSWGNVVSSVVVHIPNKVLIRDEIPHYPVSVDSTRMLSVHCYLFPNSQQCKDIKSRLGDPT